MAVWDQLKGVLTRLRDEQPGVLVQFPMPEVDEGRVPPFEIWLAPWAETTAAQLHQQFGDDLELTVGSLPYPPGRQPHHRPPPCPPAEMLDPQEITATLDGPAVVRSGHTLNHGLLVANLTSRELQIATNGQVTAVIVDPTSGERVGGYVGFQPAPLIIFRIAPRQAGRIPLLIATASSTPRLGYAIPPGHWGLQTTLTFGPDPSGPQRRTPILPLTITT